MAAGVFVIFVAIDGRGSPEQLRRRRAEPAGLAGERFG